MTIDELNQIKDQLSAPNYQGAAGSINALIWEIVRLQSENRMLLDLHANDAARWRGVEEGSFVIDPRKEDWIAFCVEHQKRSPKGKTAREAVDGAIAKLQSVKTAERRQSAGFAQAGPNNANCTNVSASGRDGAIPLG